ncbi:hypothetical protein [Lacrimispora sphenoides]|uniref:hypothetical protein n=1 Tax=Lacrimispora sphenoides TaxID=29370 RepID=UPI000B8544E9|nr:hypothetical protein [Lacrimispora sphenoides]
MARKKTVVVDIPIELLSGDRTIMINSVRTALQNGLHHYFDSDGNFTGIYINFNRSMFLADGKKRLNDCERLTFEVENVIYELLYKAKRYTTMSLKNFAEVVILKELLNDKDGGGDGNAKDGSVHIQQGNETNGGPLHKRS